MTTIACLMLLTATIAAGTFLIVHEDGDDK